MSHAHFYKFYQSPEGVVDDPGEEYKLQLLDLHGKPVQTTQFDASPYITDLNITLDETPFTLAVPFPENVVTVQVIRDGVVLGQTDTLTKLLDDAIDAIPDSGFISNPSQLRNALHNKVAALEEQIKNGEIKGAVQKLKNDIRIQLDNWLVQDYQTQTQLQYSKAEILALVDQVISRVSNLK